MDAESILKELEVFGTKQIKRNYQLSMVLYATGNYDAAYFAGMIADPAAVHEKDFEKWMETAYCGLPGFYSDDYFGKDKLASMLKYIEESIHSQPNRTKYAMNNFVIGKVTVDRGRTNCKTLLASASIQKAVEKGRLGFKRKSVRC